MDPTAWKAKEKDLVVRLIQDDESAFCELYAMYKDRLLYFAMKYLKSGEFAEDVYQDAFAAIWQTRRFINPDMPFSTYLYSIVRNRILNMMRNMDAERGLKDFILSQAVNHTEDTSDKLAESDLRKILSKAMSKLTDRQREIFYMSRNREMSYNEIAKALNISPYTVQKHMSSALKTLQDYLHKHYDVYSGLILILYCLKQ
ncbi:MAG: RNA polymerase sigma-70 factor [Dysgonamonadaceae bacterium]|jgi:RNA polymerase sigma-70 factor (ECF subfamily)|nr:RNA polymerase sigma-70 factor [Dysgonamonadaceae bacterium]